MLKNKWFMFSLALFVIPLVLNLVFIVNYRMLYQPILM